MANNLIEGLQVSILGIVIVFAVLFILSLILQLFSKIFQDKETDTGVKSSRRPETKKVVQKNPAVVEDNQKNIAVISAIMAEVLDEDQYVVNINKVN